MYLKLTTPITSEAQNFIKKQLKLGQEVFVFADKSTENEYYVETKDKKNIGYFTRTSNSFHILKHSEEHKITVASFYGLSSTKRTTVEIFINDLDEINEISEIKKIKQRGFIFENTEKGVFLAGVDQRTKVKQTLELAEEYRSFWSLFGENFKVSGIKAQAFKGNDKLVKLISKARLILDGAFQNASTLCEIEVGKWLGLQSFCDCKRLVKANLNMTRYIGDYCFNGCSSLFDVKLGRLEYLGAYSFKDCSSLVEIDLSRSLIRSIPNNAFENCLQLKKIYLPHSLNHIGDRAFKNCSSLESITFGGEISKIGVSAFENCSNLREVTFDKAISIIEKSAFDNCNNLQKIKINKSVRWLEKNLKYSDKLPFKTISLDEIKHLQRYNVLKFEKTKETFLEDPDDYIDILIELYLSETKN